MWNFVTIPTKCWNCFYPATSCNRMRLLVVTVWTCNALKLSYLPCHITKRCLQTVLALVTSFELSSRWIFGILPSKFFALPLALLIKSMWRCRLVGFCGNQLIVFYIALLDYLLHFIAPEGPTIEIRSNSRLQRSVWKATESQFTLLSSIYNNFPKSRRKRDLKISF